MSNTTLTAFILNVVTLSNASIASLVCLIILTILIFGRFFIKDVHLLLCTNTYIAIFGYSLVSGSLYVDTLRGDLQLRYEIETFTLCRIRGSVVLALLSAIFGAFCLQALFRLCRIIYRQHRTLQKYHIQMIFILIKWVFSFAFVWIVDIDYLPTEYYCSISFNTLKPALLASIIAYSLPSTIIAIIYIRIVLYIRCHRFTAANKCRTQRDFRIIQRIVLIVSVLWLLGIPSMILLFYGQIHGGHIHPLTYRIEWVTPSLALTILSIILIKYDPRLIQILFPKRCHKYKSVHIQLNATTK